MSAFRKGLAAAATGPSLCKELRTLLRKMRSYEKGTVQAIDPECLHEFRVTLRRIRTALGAGKRVFSEKKRQKFAREFKWLGRQTSPVRDAEVLLIRLDEYLELTGSSDTEDLGLLETTLRDEFREHQQRLAESLDSSRYQQLVHDFDRFLEHTPTKAKALWWNDPVKKVALRRLEKAWDKVLAWVPAGNPSFHDLRLSVKALRYLLDLWSPLFQKEKLRKLRHELSPLQAKLGELNDTAVHRRKFLRLSRNSSNEQVRRAKSANVLQGLCEKLADREDELQRNCLDAWKAFSKVSRKSRRQEFLAVRRE